MKKLFLLLLMGLLLIPSAMNAERYKSTHLGNEGDDIPVRNPTSTYVSVDLNETTGVLTLCYFGNAGSMEVTISQNGVIIENDVIAVTNGQSVIYNLSGYAIGEYLLTIETADGAIDQYILSVEDD